MYLKAGERTLGYFRSYLTLVLTHAEGPFFVVLVTVIHKMLRTTPRDKIQAYQCSIDTIKCAHTCICTYVHVHIRK